MWSVWISIALLFVASTAQAAPPTLEAALKTCRPPRIGVVLVVGAENVALPPKTDAPYTQADIYTVADAYGRLVQTFGSVTVLAPPTMTVLNTHPQKPDIYADLRPNRVFQMLAASLNDAQWAMLTSEQGIGLPDLDTDAERGMFQALFPLREVRVATQDPELAKLGDDKRPDMRDLSDQIDSLRLRLGQTARLYVKDARGKPIFFGAERPDKASRLFLFTGRRTAKPVTHGALLRADVPNVPKPGDLNLHLPALLPLIALNELATVGDLVDRVRAQTGVEVYADPHYASKTLTVLGPAAPAKDLLQAVALGVCGTFRKVGPAFVLTDDVQGVGARRQILSEWEESARADTSKLTDRAGQALLTRRVAAARTLQGFDDPLALTPAQMKSLPSDEVLPGVPDVGGGPVALKDLTPAQQDYAHVIADAWNAVRAAGNVPDYLKDDLPGAANLSGTVKLSPSLTVQLLLPGESGPVDTDFTFGPPMMLYWPGVAFLHARDAEKWKAEAAAPPDKWNGHSEAPPPLAPLLRMGKHRALVGHPRTAADVDALLLAMQKLGLNELHLDVFSDGQAHVPGFALSPSAPIVGNDILTEALQQGQKRGVTIYADMSLFSWGDAPPADTADLSILGETSRQQAVRAYRQNPEPQFDDAGEPTEFVPPPVQVSPSAPAVQQPLTALVRALAARPGLAGFVWHDADTDDGDFGFTPAARLAFLRAAHADPTDITLSGLNGRMDTSLPEWDDDGVEEFLSVRWNNARRAANVTLLKSLRVLVPPGVPVLMDEGKDDDGWLASWDSAARTAPPFRTLFTRRDDYPSLKHIPPRVHAQSRLVLSPESVGDGSELSYPLKSLRESAGWDGFVLECDDSATRGPSPLAELLAAAKSPIPTP